MSKQFYIKDSRQQWQDKELKIIKMGKRKTDVIPREYLNKIQSDLQFKNEWIKMNWACL